jgi:hypothetical protein
MPYTPTTTPLPRLLLASKVPNFHFALIPFETSQIALKYCQLFPQTNMSLFNMFCSHLGFVWFEGKKVDEEKITEIDG